MDALKLHPKRCQSGCSNQNNVPGPADLSLRESTEIEQLIGKKLRMAQYKIHRLILDHLNNL